MVRELLDDVGVRVAVPDQVRRIVSLVPSLTESVAATDRRLLVGATDWCTQPDDLDVERVGGTKNPDLALIRALAPDVVLANVEENRPADLRALRDSGLAVWVTMITSLPEAVRSLARMLNACGQPDTGWLTDIRTTWRDVLTAAPPPWACAAVPIWRRPWMTLGAGTFAGDVLMRLGVRNAHAGSDQRYPRFPSPDTIMRAGVDLVVLPDEPYAFSATDGPECFPGVPCARVSGRYLTWYGPSLTRARAALDEALRAAAHG